MLDNPAVALTILVLSLFGSGSYLDKVKERYRRWFEWTWRIKPD